MLGAASVLQRRSAATTKSEVRPPVRIFSVFNFNRVARQSKNQKLQQQKQKAAFRSSAAKKVICPEPVRKQKAKPPKTVSVFKFNRLLGQAKTKGLQQQKQKAAFRSSAAKKAICPEPIRKQKAKPPKTVSVFKFNRLLGQAKTKGLQQQKQEATFRSSAAKKNNLFRTRQKAKSKTAQNRSKQLKTADMNPIQDSGKLFGRVCGVRKVTYGRFGLESKSRNPHKAAQNCRKAKAETRSKLVKTRTKPAQNSGHEP